MRLVGGGVFLEKMSKFKKEVLKTCVLKKKDVFVFF